MTVYYQNLKNEDGEKETPFVYGKAHFLIYCARCGAGLCSEIRIEKDGKFNKIYVNPCKCTEKEKTND